MRVLVACEESQTVCKAFRARGHEAYSCDLLPCSGGHPEWHIQKDVKSLLCYSNLYVDHVLCPGNDPDRFDLVISFPPCMHLATSGAKHFDKKRLSGEQELAIQFFLDVWYYSHCTENPKGIMSGGRYIKKWFPDLYRRLQENHYPFKASQVIQPWQFGHPETKETHLWLRDLPALVHTNNVYDEMMKLPKKERARVHHAVPGPQRSVLRSKTYSGVAEAMAQQWG